MEASMRVARRVVLTTPRGRGLLCFLGLLLGKGSPGLHIFAVEFDEAECFSARVLQGRGPALQWKVSCFYEWICIFPMNPFLRGVGQPCEAV